MVARAGAIAGTRGPDTRPAIRASGRTGRRIRQERRLPRCTRCAGIQPRRDRHCHAAAAAGQSQAAAVPGARVARADQSHGFQQQGRGSCRRAAAGRELSRHSRREHRQECRHAAGRGPPTTTSNACASSMRTRTISPSTCRRRIRRACATCRPRSALAGIMEPLQREARELAARHGRQVPLLVKISPDLPAAELSGLCRALLRSRDRWRDRHQQQHGNRAAGSRARPGWREQGRCQRRTADGALASGAHRTSRANWELRSRSSAWVA